MRPRILLIDDDPSVLRTLEIILLDLGYEVQTAQDGERGLRQFRASRPDLVVTDILMPNKEGIETIIEMRRLRAEAKIIAMSGGGPINKQNLLTMAAKLGADRILPKPLDRDQFAELVESLVGPGSPHLAGV